MCNGNGFDSYRRGNARPSRQPGCLGVTFCKLGDWFDGWEELLPAVDNLKISLTLTDYTEIVSRPSWAFSRIVRRDLCLTPALGAERVLQRYAGL
jgi:hypothetical protein